MLHNLTKFIITPTSKTVSPPIKSKFLSIFLSRRISAAFTSILVYIDTMSKLEIIEFEEISTS